MEKTQGQEIDIKNAHCTDKVQDLQWSSDFSSELRFTFE